MAECLRHHADDRVARVVELNRLPENIFAAAKISLPEIVPDDGDPRSTGLVFGLGEIAAAHRLQSQNRQKVRADPRGWKTLGGFAGSSGRNARTGGNGKSFEDIRAVLAPLQDRLLGHV